MSLRWPLQNEFCCLAPLRTGCIIIGVFKIITATMYLIGYFSKTNDSHDDNKGGEYFFQEGITISLIGCAFNYVIAVVLLLGIFKAVPIIILISAIIVMQNTVFDLAAAAYTGYEHHFAPCVSLVIYSALELYFALVVYSHYMEIKEEERFRASMDEVVREELERERIRAREQGLPDPFKAALLKYRASVGEERERKGPPTVKPGEASNSQQPPPSGN